MTLWMPNKKRPLYAPMLGSLGGGSARGWGRGGRPKGYFTHVNTGNSYGTGMVLNLQSTREEHVFQIEAGNTIRVTLSGAAGAPSLWASSSPNTHPGAPGDVVHVDLYFSADTEFYGYIGEGGPSYGVSGSGGSGGGSTDLRMNKASTGSASTLDTTFRSNFYSGMSSILAVAGGGGGSHGDSSYGSWGSFNSPGRGGFTKTQTNATGNADNGYVDVGADGNGPGQDGGNSVDPYYTTNGVFGGGGESNGLAYTNYWSGSFPSSAGFSRYLWPNGGTGSTWVTGGGGGGYYGGASNWPNGGGGSSKIGSGQNVQITHNTSQTLSNSGTGAMQIEFL